jgi:hypothetical protein
MEDVFSKGLKPGLVVVALALMAACGEAAFPEKPDLPASVSPGWALKSYESSGVPEGLPAGEAPRCWKALYAGAGGASADVWVCGYRGEGGAFDAVQRARAAANTVKFYKGKFLVVVRWSGGSRAELTALIAVLEKGLR